MDLNKIPKPPTSFSFGSNQVQSYSTHTTPPKLGHNQSNIEGSIISICDGILLYAATYMGAYVLSRWYWVEF